MLDSLVRVSRRVDERHFVSITNPLEIAHGYGQRQHRHCIGPDPRHWPTSNAASPLRAEVNINVFLGLPAMAGVPDRAANPEAGPPALQIPQPPQHETDADARSHGLSASAQRQETNTDGGAMNAHPASSAAPLKVHNRESEPTGADRFPPNNFKHF